MSSPPDRNRSCACSPPHSLDQGQIASRRRNRRRRASTCSMLPAAPLAGTNRTIPVQRRLAAVESPQRALDLEAVAPGSKSRIVSRPSSALVQRKLSRPPPPASWSRARCRRAGRRHRRRRRGGRRWSRHPGNRCPRRRRVDPSQSSPRISVDGRRRRTAGRCPRRRRERRGPRRRRRCRCLALPRTMSLSAPPLITSSSSAAKDIVLARAGARSRRPKGPAPRSPPSPTGWPRRCPKSSFGLPVKSRLSMPKPAPLASSIAISAPPDPLVLTSTRCWPPAL